jgi:hypothetical protein
MFSGIVRPLPVMYATVEQEELTERDDGKHDQQHA